MEVGVHMSIKTVKIFLFLSSLNWSFISLTLNISYIHKGLLSSIDVIKEETNIGI